jgi:hypothetical protein
MNKPWKGKLEDLIQWFGSIDPGNKLLADSCRILRNTIHTPEMASESNALEKIRHCVAVLNSAFPYPAATHLISQSCSYCGVPTPYEVQADRIFYGNTIEFDCGACQARFSIMVQP